MLGIPATSALAETYPPHAITQNFTVGTLYPHSGGLKVLDAKDTHWQATPLVQSTSRSWLEAGKLQGVVEFNDSIDTMGPINIALVMEKKLSNDKTQRVVVVADSDFISNQYLGNLGNKDMGLKIFNWLNNDDKLISIAATTAPDQQIQLDPTLWAVIGLFFLAGLPVIFIASGIIIWRKRRNR